MNKVDKDEKNVLKCKYCDRVLGVNYKGRKHKCTCQGAEAIVDAYVAIAEAKIAVAALEVAEAAAIKATEAAEAAEAAAIKATEAAEAAVLLLIRLK